MNKVLQLSLRSIVRLLNDDTEWAKIYKSRALELSDKLTFEDRRFYLIEERIPRVIKNKLYEMVS